MRGIRRLKKVTDSYPRNRHHRLTQERGCYLKKWTGRTPIALIYPNTYAVGMSSLGFQLVYALLNERNDIVCERFFLSEKDQNLLSVESGRPLRDFPLLFFSVSFEQDYVNIVRILLQGGVEPYAAQRDQSIGKSPLVVCGGVATFMNPEPIAAFVDCFVIGEAEPVLDPLVAFLQEKYTSTTRTELLLAAARQFDGIYAPRFYTAVYDEAGRCAGMEVRGDVPPAILRLQLKKCQNAGHSQLLSADAEFADLYLTELGRGCSRGCRFCAAGFIYRPPRLWDADAIVRSLAERSTKSGRVGLLGMEMASDDALDRISTYLMESGCALSFSSLRADRINGALLDLLARSNLKSVAIAPDGASQRLRSVINKGLDASDLLCAARRLVEAGIYKLKLYIMVGLPTETFEDLQEFVDLVHAIKREIDPIGQRRGRLTEIYLSVNCFVPKPWTPFQYHPFGISNRLLPGDCRSSKEAIDNLKDRIFFLRERFQAAANIHFKADKPENVLFQALLSRGDRRLADVLFDMASARIPWKSSMKSRGLDPERSILCGYDGDSYFPWYIINHGIDHSYLWREYLKGFEAAATVPCDPSLCRRCGVCGET